MIQVAKAFDIIGAKTPLLGTEKIALSDSVGRVLAQDIAADTDLPPFDRSQMDGYAVIAADTKNAPVTLAVVGESAAGRGWHKSIRPGEAVRIMTGAPMPKGADGVQKVELTKETDTGGGRAEVVIAEPTEKGRYIVRKGSEIEQGKTIFEKGQRITDGMIAPLAAFGYACLTAGKRPRVAILGTGSEIVAIDKKPGRDQIRNSNSVMLDVLCGRFGGESTVFPIVRDDISDLKFEISNAVRQNDIVVITGGVSVGKYDHTKTALAELGAEIFFDKVRLKPGKPAVFARIGKTLIFGLPGNPVSASVTFHLFVRRAMLIMQGAAEVEMRSGYAVLTSDAKGTRERDTYLPSHLDTNKAGQLIARPLRWLGSSDLIGSALADSLVIVPKGRVIPKGEVARIVYL